MKQRFCQIKNTLRLIHFAVSIVGCVTIYNFAQKIIPCIEKYGWERTIKMIFP